GDWEAVADAYARLALQLDADIDTHLQHGHAHHLLGRYEQAIAAYREGVAWLDAKLEDEQSDASLQVRQTWEAQRWSLILQIARLQRGGLNDPETAIALVNEAAAELPLLIRPLPSLIAHREE